MTAQDEATNKKEAENTASEQEVDDIEFESYNDDVGGITSTPEDKIRKLKEKLKQSEKERLEYLDGWQRAKADFVNYKKREEEGKGEFMKFAREAIITDILPVLESFDMAFANKEAWQKVDNSWRVGVEYIHSQLSTILRDNGLAEVDPTGKTFDPSEHTAISTVKTDDVARAHTIAEVIQKGYRINGKLVRSPKVRVYEVENMQPTDEK